jgi:hypothetical protein
MDNAVLIVVAIIGAASLIIAAVISARAGNKKQLEEIHVLVNSRLTEALDEINNLKEQIVSQGGDPETLFPKP